jgi:uncharacterized protein
MRIAIIGSGISGLVAAYKLHQKHEVTVFEANDYIGGHTNTVEVDVDGQNYAIDTGFIVFNDRTYPNFCQLMDDLQVESRPTTMSFSVRAEHDNLEYNGSSLSGLFAQKRNLLRPKFYRMVCDILRFNRESLELLDDDNDTITVGEYLRQKEYSTQFADHYLLPMGAAIWSCPTAAFEAFPMRFIVEFYKNHGLLSLKDRPTWRVITGGSQQYVAPLTNGFRDRTRLSCPVTGVYRNSHAVTLRTSDAEETFDEVVFACHSDQALRILGNDAGDAEREVLGAIRYEPNIAVLHTDESVLPTRKTAWAAWNYHVPSGQTNKSTLTYNMNILQHIESDHTFCVTLNEEARIDSEKVLGTFKYSHPVFTVERSTAQARHSQLIRSNRTSFCGAYWGNGFHEDGVNSALAVVREFESPTVNTTKVRVHA